MKKFNIRLFSKNQYVVGNCLKRGELGQFADLRGSLTEKRRGGGGFLRGVDTPMHTMIENP